MNNENFENIKEDSLQDSIGFLKRKNSHLEGDLEILENNLQEKQKHTESIERELDGAQVTLSQIEEILDKLKINGAGNYEIPASELKYIQNLYETRN